MAIKRSRLFSMKRPDKRGLIGTYWAVVVLEVEGWVVGFVDFAEVEGVWDEAFTSLDFYEVFAPLPAIVEGEADGVFVVVGFKLPFPTVSITGI